VRCTPTLACAALMLASGGLALAGEPPKCREAAKLAWYQRAVEVTNGDAAPHAALPEWCWPENEYPRAAPRPVKARAENSGGAEGPAKTVDPAMSPRALRKVPFRDDVQAAED
jgi:hypothetical protein